MKTILKPLAQSLFIPLRFTSIESLTNAAIQNNIFGSSIYKLQW